VSWPLVKLSEVVSIKGGGTPSKNIEEYWGGDIPWASVKDFKSTILEKTVDFITQLGVENSATNVIPAGSIVVPSRMAVGKVAMLSVDMAINQDLKALIVKDVKKLDKRYLLRFLESQSTHIIKQAKGATVKGITLDVLLNLEIPLPYPDDPEKSLKEQKRIAAILDKADGIRRKRQQAIQLADDFLRSVFLDMFGDPVTNPKGWEVKKFGEICKCSQGIQVDTELQSNEYKEGYSPFLRIINYTQNSKEIRFIPTPETEKAKIQSDDVVMVRYGATAGFVGRGLEGVLANNLFKIGFSTKYFTSDFLFYFLTSDYFQDILISSRKGGAMPAISFGQLNNINITVPTLARQKEFSKLLELNAVISSLNREAKAEPLFDSLSQKAFSGKL